MISYTHSSFIVNESFSISQPTETFLLSDAAIDHCRQAKIKMIFLLKNMDFKPNIME